MGKKICLVTGVGPGTGSSIVRRFASGGYNVIMVSRSEDRLNKLEKQTENTFSYPCDVSNETLKFRDTRETFVGGVPVILNRISFSGELGYEIYTAPQFQLKLFE